MNGSKIDKVKRKVRELTEDDFFKTYGHLRIKRDFAEVRHNTNNTEYDLQYSLITLRVRKSHD